MNAKQLERAAYIAHAVLSANTSAPHLATPGARRSYMIDVIADKIKGVFELHCSALDESTDWWTGIAAFRRPIVAAGGREATPQPGSGGQKRQLIVQELH
jgi:hypothetical protein